MKTIALFSKPVLGLFALSLLFTFLSSCKDNSYVAPPPPQVTIVQPVIGVAQLSKEYPAYTEAALTVNVVARVKGYLEEVKFRSGQVVNKGDVLYVIEPTNYQDAVTEAQANMENATAGLSLAMATQERVIQASLSDAVSELDVLQAKAETDQAYAELKNSEANLNSAKTDLSYCYVTAPCSGRITRTLIDQGNLVGLTGTDVLATIYQSDPLYIYFNVEDKALLAGVNNFKNVKIDRPEDVGYVYISTSIDNDFDTTLKAKVDYIAPTVDIETGTVVARAALENKDNRLFPGLYVKVKVPYREISNAIMIPEAAISSNQAGRYLKIVGSDNKVEERQITVGAMQGKKMRIIESGIKEGEWFIVTGLQRARHGVLVTPEKTTVEKFIGNE